MATTPAARTEIEGALKGSDSPVLTQQLSGVPVRIVFGLADSDQGIVDANGVKVNLDDIEGNENWKTFLGE